MDAIKGRVLSTPTANFPFQTLIIIGGKTYQRGVATEVAGFDLINDMFACITADANAPRP